MNPELLEKFAKTRMNEEEKKLAEEEKKKLEPIPAFESYFWLGKQIRDGQTSKGFLNMPDCELFLLSMQRLYDCLKMVVKDERNQTAIDNFECKEPVLADEGAFQSFHILKTVSESLQETGFFSLEESVLALSHLRKIADVLNSNMDPEYEKERMAFNLKEKKEDLKQQRTKKQGKKNGKNQRR